MRQQVKLGTIIQQIRGVSYKPTDVRNADDPDAVALLRANNIQDAGLNFDDLVFVDKKKVSPEQMIRKGDIVICASSGSKNLVGKAAVADCDMPYTFGAFCKVVRITSMDAAFVGQYFRSPRYRSEISAASAGANINNIRNEHIDEMYIPVYTEAEQREIARQLLHIDALIRDRHEQLTLIDQLVKSRFIELFGEPLSNTKGWKTMPIVEAAPIKSQRGDLEEEIWLLNLDAVEAQTGAVLFKHRVQSTEINASTVYFTTDNVLYSKLRPYLNKVVMPNEDGVATSEMITLLPIADLLNRAYLCYWLRSDAFVKHISEKVAGAKMPRVSMDYFRSLAIEIPPLDLQEQFSTFVEQTDKSKFLHYKALSCCRSAANLYRQEWMTCQTSVS